MKKFLSTNLIVELVGKIWKTPEDVALFLEAAELVRLLLSAGGGGRCAVRQHGGPEEG